MTTRSLCIHIFFYRSGWRGIYKDVSSRPSGLKQSPGHLKSRGHLIGMIGAWNKLVSSSRIYTYIGHISCAVSGHCVFRVGDRHTYVDTAEGGTCTSTRSVVQVHNFAITLFWETVHQYLEPRPRRTHCHTHSWTVWETAHLYRGLIVAPTGERALPA
jgi:hypothetical protein